MYYRNIILSLFLTILLTSTIWSAPEKYNIEVEGNLILLSRDSCKAQMGITEATGNNDGVCYKYQKPFGLKNQSYCAMAQDWSYWINNGKVKLPWFSPNAQKHFNYAKKHGEKVAYKAEIDDFIVWAKGSVNGHIERVYEVLAYGWVRTYGFNTSNGLKGSQANGNGNFPRLRHLFNPVGILLMKGLVGVKPYQKINNNVGCNLK